MDQALIIGLLAATLRIATPILLAALGEVFAERAGVLNLGIEGIMLLGALVGFMAAYLADSLWIGLLAAMLAGLLAGLLMAWLAVTLGLNQHVSGLGLTLLASGLALFFFRVLFKGTANAPKITPFPTLSLPALGPVAPIFEQYWMTYVAFLLVPIAAVVLQRTTFGLWVRSVGENPEAADSAGVSVARVRYATLMLSGVLMAAGGAFLSLAQLGTATFGIVAGRGWVAIALVIFGNWQPVKVMLGALIFGGVEALQLRLRAIGIPVPYQLLLALPYLVTIAALAVAGRNASYPAALLRPYKRKSRFCTASRKSVTPIETWGLLAPRPSRLIGIHMTRQYYVYIMASISRVLYVGVTNNLMRRVAEHKAAEAKGFTKRYKVNRLVHLEATGDVRAAIEREKQIKGWSRSKKIALIEGGNPGWRDLSLEWDEP